MGQLSTLVNEFDGGMVNDPRVTTPNVARVVTNFDILTDKHRLRPYHSSESGDTAASTSKKQNFCTAIRTGTTSSVYALGVVSGQVYAEILYKDLSSGLGDGVWSTPANNQSASGPTNFNLFVYYKKTGLIYGAKSGTNIWAFSPSGAAFDEDKTGTDGAGTGLPYTNIAQGIVHTDDILYIPYDNKICSVNNTTWNKTALTLPSEFYITSICTRGNYLAIACAPLSGVGRSRLYLWDTVSTSWSDNIDCGEEKLLILEEVDGVLICISSSAGNSTRFQERIIFRQLVGSSAVKFSEFLSENTSTSLSTVKQKINNRIYFLMSIKLNGATREGVWSVGRNSPYSPFSIIHERTSNNDTALTVSGSSSLKGFFSVGDYMFISYQDAGTFGLSKTDDQANYTATSIYETIIYNAIPGLKNRRIPDSTTNKKWLGVTVAFEPLTSGQTVVLKYKIDNQSAWTTIFTYSTINTLSHAAINTESDGVTLPVHAELQLRLESTGGAVITAFDFLIETIDDSPYK